MYNSHKYYFQFWEFYYKKNPTKASNVGSKKKFNISKLHSFIILMYSGEITKHFPTAANFRKYLLLFLLLY